MSSGLVGVLERAAAHVVEVATHEYHAALRLERRLPRRSQLGLRCLRRRLARRRALGLALARVEQALVVQLVVEPRQPIADWPVQHTELGDV